MIQAKKVLMLACALIFFITVAVSNVAQAQTNEERKDLTEIYEKITKGFKAKDVKVLQGYESADFKAKQTDGKVAGKAEYDQGLSQFFSSVKEVKQMDIKIDKMEDGKGEDDILVHNTQTFSLILVDPNGKEHTFVATSKSVDTWTYDDKAGWKLIYSEDKESNVTLDGNPLK